MRTNLIFFWSLTVCVNSVHAQSLSRLESLENDGQNERYLISNRSAGQILGRSSADTLSFLSDDPNSAAGMEIVGQTVFVADGSFIRGYRLSDAQRVVNYSISAGFLNGLAGDGGTRLWVSDFSGQIPLAISASFAAMLRRRRNSASMSSPHALPDDEIHRKHCSAYLWHPTLENSRKADA